MVLQHILNRTIPLRSVGEKQTHFHLQRRGSGQTKTLHTPPPSHLAIQPSSQLGQETAPLTIFLLLLLYAGGPHVQEVVAEAYPTQPAASARGPAHQAARITALKAAHG